MLLKFERKSCYFFFILKSKSFQFFCKATGALESGQADVFKKYSALKRNGKPEEIAALFALLLDERLGFLTGADILMDGGVVASGASGLSK